MRRIIALALASMFMISAFGVFFGDFAQAAEPKNGTRAMPEPNGIWYDPSWAQVTSIYISNANNVNTLYNYQVKLNLQYLPGMRADFGDVRFTTDDGTTELPYWMESKTDSVVATFWVNVPEIPGSSTILLYAYYNNPAATYSGSGSSVFMFFDDFSSIAGWTAYGPGVSVSSPAAGIMQLNNPGSLTRAWAVPNTVNNFGNFVLEMTYLVQNNAVGEEGGPLIRIPGSPADGQIDGYQPALRGRTANDMPVWRMDNMWNNAAGITQIAGGGTGWAVLNSWYHGLLTANGATMSWYPDTSGHVATSVTWTDSTYGSGNIGIWEYSASVMQVDWLFTRKLANPEPRVWLDPAWNQLATMTIVNSNAATLTDYQVKVTTPLLDGMRADFGDVRFTMDGSISWLPYWMERNQGSSATFWVKIPTLPGNSNTRLCAYYDNPAATYMGDGNNVFIFFDDFSGAAVDTGKWIDDTTQFTVSGGYLHGSFSNYRLRSAVTFTGPIISETRTRGNTVAANGEQVLGFWASAANSIGLLAHGGPVMYVRNNGAWPSSWGWNHAPWLNARATINTGGTGQFYLLNDVGTTYTYNFNNVVSGERLALGRRYDDANYGQNYNQEWDWIFVRKWASPEPLINMNPENKDDTISLDEDSINYSINPLDNDNDVEGNTPLSISYMSSAQHGYTELVGNQLRYTPDANYNGPDLVRYRVVDTWGNGDDGFIRINVLNVNDIPVAEDDFYEVKEDSINNTFSILVNDYDVDGDILSFDGISGTLNGKVAAAPDGVSLLYTPNPDFYGTDTFQYTIMDGNGGTDVATVTITVVNMPEPPAPTQQEIGSPPLSEQSATSSAAFNMIVAMGILVAIAIVLLVVLGRRKSKD
ncbi:MAG: DUF2341 domain-containing protein [Methanobacteriota archaeon]